jgi:hypothetical protein
MPQLWADRYRSHVADTRTDINEAVNLPIGTCIAVPAVEPVPPQQPYQPARAQELLKPAVRV